MQELKPTDHNQYRTFVNWLREQVFHAKLCWLRNLKWIPKQKKLSHLRRRQMSSNFRKTIVLTKMYCLENENKISVTVDGAVH